MISAIHRLVKMVEYAIIPKKASRAPARLIILGTTAIVCIIPIVFTFVNTLSSSSTYFRFGRLMTALV